MGVEGLKSEALKAALSEALGGDVARLEALLARHGGLPGPRPNLKLAAAFGVELAQLPGELAPLLTRLGEDEAAAESARAFLPIAAAHGWAQRIAEGREVEPGWRALEQLAADSRGPVRVGTLDALIAFALRAGGAELLLERVRAWLEEEERELCFGAAALAVEVFADPRVLATLRDPEPLLAYLSRAIERVADAPRAAERSQARRRLLTSFAPALASIIALVRAGERGARWFEAECARAQHPDVRAALSAALQRLARQPHAPPAALADELRAKLEESAKPLRDPTRVRPGTGRGRRSRSTR